MNKVPTAFAARGISKSFGQVHALSNVELDLPAGEVTALMGENGAGKSTLLKVLSGDYPPDSGKLLLNDKPVKFSGPLAARSAGVRVIAQEPEIIPYVSVAENLYLGMLPTRAGFFSKSQALNQATDYLETIGFAQMLDPKALGVQLSPAQRQLVEIARALIDDPKIICFDEPTSSLSEAETTVLFGLIQHLRNRGRAIVYVSHRMKEVFAISDSITVLRDGQYMGNFRTDQTDEGTIVRQMVGRDLSSLYHRERHQTGVVRLKLNHVTTDDVRDISMEVRAGEVVALAGLVGAGRSELALAIAGDRPIRSGQIEISGTNATLSSPADAISLGVGLAPEERKADALIMEQSVRENISVSVLDRLSKHGFISRKQEKDLGSKYVAELRIRTPTDKQLVRNLSGGNQQKVVLSRWLARDCDVLILDEPTRGVDVGAKSEIYGIIDDLARKGTAVLVISSELPEVLGLADRILVMSEGRITGELDRDSATEESILALAMVQEEGNVA